ncbi:MAG: caspase family protein, partial [Cyanobacteria bacterium J06648_11]
MRRHLVLFIFVLLSFQHAVAERRLALVISNEAYGPEIGPLAKSHEDAEMVSRALSDVGFEVRRQLDADASSMAGALRDFEKSIESAGPDTVAFFYYSGHGGTFVTDGQTSNFLIPAGEPIKSIGELRSKSVDLDRITSRLGALGAKAVFVVIDACRSSSLDQGSPLLGFSAPSASSFRESFTPSRMVPGTLVAISSSGDATPDDSVYAQALAKHLRTPGISVHEVFSRVNDEAELRSQGAQMPTYADGLGEEFCFQECGPRSAQASSTTSAEQLLWERLRSGDEARGLESFLESFPDGEFAADARRRLRALNAEAAVSPSPNTGSSSEALTISRDEGRIIYHTPDRMVVGEPYFLEAVIRPLGDETVEAVEAELRSAIGSGRANSSKNDPLNNTVDDIEVSEYLTARLSGIGFEIQEEVQAEQLIQIGRNTKWLWTVVPAVTGDQPLVLKLYEVVEDSNGKRSERLIRSYRNIIEVRPVEALTTRSAAASSVPSAGFAPVRQESRLVDSEPISLPAGCSVRESENVDPDRFALVLANQIYPPDIGELQQTHLDGDRLAEALELADFSVTYCRDLSKQQGDDALSLHAEKIAKRKDEGGEPASFFYYSGHGL